MRQVKKIKIPALYTDSCARLGVLGAVALMQDNMCEYFRQYGADSMSMVDSHNCFFVITKTRAHFDRQPNWLDDVVVDTDIASESRVRLNLKHRLTSNDELIISGLQELCVMDYTTRSLRKIESSAFPILDIDNDSNNMAFEKFDFDNYSDWESFDKVVAFTNVDVCGHTNNLEYVRLILDAMSVDEYKSISITDFEIHYIHESKLGDGLTILKKYLLNCYVYRIMRDGDCIAEAKIYFK